MCAHLVLSLTRESSSLCRRELCEQREYDVRLYLRYPVSEAAQPSLTKLIRFVVRGLVGTRIKKSRSSKDYHRCDMTMSSHRAILKKALGFLSPAQDGLKMRKVLFPCLRQRRGVATAIRDRFSWIQQRLRLPAFRHKSDIDEYLSVLRLMLQGRRDSRTGS